MSHEIRIKRGCVVIRGRSVAVASVLQIGGGDGDERNILVGRCKVRGVNMWAGWESLNKLAAEMGTRRMVGQFSAQICRPHLERA